MTGSGVLGSACASRAGFGALAETNFLGRVGRFGLAREQKFAMARAPSPARVGACAPQDVLDNAILTSP
jgi:hypothetical protein